MGVSLAFRAMAATGAAGATGVAALTALAAAGCGLGSGKPEASTSTVITRSFSPTRSAPFTTPPGPGGKQLEQQYEQVVRQVLPSVVQISTEDGEASGVVFDNQGSIITNAHVVAGAKNIRVTPATGGRAAPATVLGRFDADDLAALRVSGLTLRPARFADSSSVQVGQLVLAMGNPLGLTGGVTNGIVSAMGRTVVVGKTADFKGATIANTIQTNAEINPGNSGGALIALSGEVVGIPVAGARTDKKRKPAAGIGFAIPSNTVTRIAPQLIQHGRVTDSGRGALGVTVRTVIDDTTLQPRGVQIMTVNRNGPAAKAGLDVGEVIVSVDGTPTPNQTVLAEVLADKAPGEQVTVVIQPQGGENRTVQVPLGTLPGS